MPAEAELSAEGSIGGFASPQAIAAAATATVTANKSAIFFMKSPPRDEPLETLSLFAKVHPSPSIF
jgi:hypothetical protein